jgi:hypothetical protein
LIAALKVVESGDRRPPAQALELFREADETMREQAAAWSKMKTGTLADLNAFLREQNMKTIQISEIEREVYELMTR